MKLIRKIVAALLITTALLPFNTFALNEPNATYNKATVIIDGNPTTFEAYTISGYNYFKLRDLAYVLNNTKAKFDISYYTVSKSIYIYSGLSYQSVGGEMAISNNPKDTFASPSNSIICFDGRTVYLTVYTIGDNNYFKLRDVAAYLNLEVSWDENNNTICINTSAKYIPETAPYEYGEKLVKLLGHGIEDAYEELGKNNIKAVVYQDYTYIYYRDFTIRFETRTHKIWSITASSPYINIYGANINMSLAETMNVLGNPAKNYSTDLEYVNKYIINDNASLEISNPKNNSKTSFISLTYNK